MQYVMYFGGYVCWKLMNFIIFYLFISYINRLLISFWDGFPVSNTWNRFLYGRYNLSFNHF